MAHAGREASLGDQSQLPEMITLRLKVVPGARKTRVVGRLGDALKVQVSAPPEGGKANGAVVELLAEFFGVKRDAVTITAGHTQARKTVVLDGITQQQIDEALARK